MMPTDGRGNGIPPRGSNLKKIPSEVMMSFDISAPSGDDVTIKRLTVSHKGDSAQDIEAVYLCINGARLSPVEAFDSNGKATLHFMRPVSVEPNEIITVDVDVDFDPRASAGSQHRLLIESEDSLVTNANTTEGSFPAHGETFGVGAVTCGLISIKYLSLEPEISTTDSIKPTTYTPSCPPTICLTSPTPPYLMPHSF